MKSAELLNSAELYGVLKINLLVDHTRKESKDTAGYVRPVRIATCNCTRGEAEEVYANFKKHNQHIDGSMMRATWSYEDQVR